MSFVTPISDAVAIMALGGACSRLDDARVHLSRLRVRAGELEAETNWRSDAADHFARASQRWNDDLRTLELGIGILQDDLRSVCSRWAVSGGELS